MKVGLGFNMLGAPHLSLMRNPARLNYAHSPRSMRCGHPFGDSFPYIDDN